MSRGPFKAPKVQCFEYSQPKRGYDKSSGNSTVQKNNLQAWKSFLPKMSLENEKILGNLEIFEKWLHRAQKGDRPLCNFYSDMVLDTF